MRSRLDNDTSQLVSTDQLTAQFDQNGKMDVLHLATSEHKEYVPRMTLVQTAEESPSIKQSPNASKSSKKNQKQQQKQQQQEPQRPQVPVPESAFHEYGTTKVVWHFLEVNFHQLTLAFLDTDCSLCTACRNSLSHGRALPILPGTTAAQSLRGPIPLVSSV